MRIIIICIVVLLSWNHICLSLNAPKLQTNQAR